ncbi:single-stranded DNA-binding protein [filamentous cyanobacterium LEGE 11480]|uniref:Single-stranded DNA-binding protein n=1 Tax=Romeriopsis navalis LEGE 11480 TaxID=2777977 RepID=A0A928VRH7_9CYAN|nr:single-stranded DNA-binding protein [Romeriopsis navalis]MBE9032412.1 single-stranded DNA-binding protein [Romeriopsis navalis LEGE 11480]
MVAVSMRNQATIEGRVGNVPELRYTSSQKAVVNLSIAISNDYKAKDSDEWVKREPTWIEVVVWGKQAERCIESTAKGCRVQIHGSLTTIKKKRSQTVGNGKLAKPVEVEYKTIGITAAEIRYIDKPNSATESIAEPDF